MDREFLLNIIKENDKLIQIINKQTERIKLLLGENNNSYILKKDSIKEEIERKRMEMINEANSIKQKTMNQINNMPTNFIKNGR